LVIAIDAFEGAEQDAVQQVRALLAQLSAGAVSERDVARAGAELARESLAASLDPRQRAVELWRGRERPPASLASLRRFLKSTLRAEAQLVVRVTPAD
jgi:hypothetical protein